MIALLTYQAIASMLHHLMAGHYKQGTCQAYSLDESPSSLVYVAVYVKHGRPSFEPISKELCSLGLLCNSWK